MPEFTPLSSFSILQFLLAALLITTLRTYNEPNAWRQAFDAGLLVCGMMLLWFPSVMLLLFVFSALAVLRPFNWREWNLALLGFSTPVWLIFTFCFVTGCHEFFSGLVSFELVFDILPRQLSTAEISIVSLWLGILLVAAWTIQRALLKKTMMIRKYLALTIWLLAFTFASALMLMLRPYEPAEIIRHFSMAGIPSAIITAYYLAQLRNRKAAEAIHLILLALTFFVQFQHHLFN
jgi:hypothetical protein